MSEFLPELMRLDKVQIRQDDWPASTLYKEASEFLVVVLLRGRGDILDIASRKNYLLNSDHKVVYVDNEIGKETTVLLRLDKESYDLLVYVLTFKKISL